MSLGGDELCHDLHEHGWFGLSGEQQDALIASGWHPGPNGGVSAERFNTVRRALNQLTDHGSQKCLDCLHWRELGQTALNELEMICNQTVTKLGDPPITKERGEP